jgi:endoribonuclease LACTB2
MREIRLAASVIGVRDAVDGPQVLVIERSLDHRFLPGYVAFPEGAVDRGDRSLVARWFGDEREVGRAAALRELAEEVGLAITAGGVISTDPPGVLDPVDAAPPPVERLSEIARWIAPERVPVRFDARYYAVRIEDGDAPSADGDEAAAAWWRSPRELLDGWEAGDLFLYWPTHFTMRALARCRSADELCALRIATREPREDELGVLPRSVFFQD